LYVTGRRRDSSRSPAGRIRHPSFPGSGMCPQVRGLARRAMWPCRVALGENGTRKVEADVVMAEQGAAQCEGISDRYQHHDEQSVAEAMQRSATVGLAGANLESIALDDPGELPGLTATAHPHVAAYHADVLQVGMRSEITRKLGQRAADRAVHPVHPCNAAPTCAERGQMLVPQVQGQSATTGAHRRAVRELERLVDAHGLDAKQALRMRTVFVDSLKFAEPAVQGEYAGSQPTVDRYASS
jgi:hypothetical protein